MPNTNLTPSIIAKVAVPILENALVMAKKVYRGYESEFSQKVNGYKQGQTITIRRPTDFVVGVGPVIATAQDVREGSVTLSVDRQRNVSFEFTSQELTLQVDVLAERVIKPAMIQLANQIDLDLLNLYRQVPAYVGTPGAVVDTFAKFARGPERLDQFGVMQDNRCAVLSPPDQWGLLGSQTALFIAGAANGAYRDGSLGNIGGVETYMSQNVATHTVGALGGTPVVDGAGQNVAYTAVMTTGTQVLNLSGWTASVANVMREGDIFTIASVFAVNPVTKAVLPFLRQFVVRADIASTAAGLTALTISPPIITTGAFQTCSAAPANLAAITVLGAANTGFRQNMMFHKNAFALALVPMESPPGAVDVARESFKGCSVRIIPVYDGVNDLSRWRCDVLYGIQCIDPRLAVRVNG